MCHICELRLVSLVRCESANVRADSIRRMQHTEMQRMLSLRKRQQKRLTNSNSWWRAIQRSRCALPASQLFSTLHYLLYSVTWPFFSRNWEMRTYDYEYWWFHIFLLLYWASTILLYMCTLYFHWILTDIIKLSYNSIWFYTRIFSDWR